MVGILSFRIVFPDKMHYGYMMTLDRYAIKDIFPFKLKAWESYLSHRFVTTRFIRHIESFRSH